MKRLFIIFSFLPILLHAQEKFTINDPEHHPDTIKKKTALLDKIFLSDSIKIIASSWGCFHHYSITYKVIRKSSYFEVIKIDGANIEKRMIRKDRFNSLHDLCIHGLNIGLGFCTTHKNFLISDHRLQTEFSDSRCDDKDDILNRLTKLLD